MKRSCVATRHPRHSKTSSVPPWQTAGTPPFVALFLLQWRMAWFIFLGRLPRLLLQGGSNAEGGGTTSFACVETPLHCGAAGCWPRHQGYISLSTNLAPALPLIAGAAASRFLPPHFFHPWIPAAAVPTPSSLPRSLECEALRTPTRTAAARAIRTAARLRPNSKRGPAWGKKKTASTSLTVGRRHHLCHLLSQQTPSRFAPATLGPLGAAPPSTTSGPPHPALLASGRVRGWGKTHAAHCIFALKASTLLPGIFLARRGVCYMPSAPEIVDQLAFNSRALVGLRPHREVPVCFFRKNWSRGRQYYDAFLFQHTRIGGREGLTL